MVQQNVPEPGREGHPTDGPFALARRAMMRCLALVALGAFATAALATTTNHYGVIISKAQTKNMTFAGGVYSPTADGAVLNVDDLENALAAGNVEVTTGNGSGGDEKGDIHFNAALTWSSASALTLDAYRAIFVVSPVTDAGTGALSVKIDDGGSGGFLTFLRGGSISIWSLSNRLTINTKAFTLVADVKTLASDIAADPTGRFALASAYDASQDGHYSSAPIPAFSGVFNGLGNAISNLTIRDHVAYDNVGFFGTLTGAKVSSILLTTEVLVATGEGATSGGLAGTAQQSDVVQAGVTGKIFGPSLSSSPTGGLIGVSENGVVTDSYANVDLKAAGESLGGLVGYNNGIVSRSWAAGKTTGTVTNALVGNLVGFNEGGTIEDSYSTGSVSARAESVLGGLVGYNNGHSPLKESYSIGHVDVAGGTAGGLIGEDGNTEGWDQKCYWDTSTSGIANLSQGAGQPANDPGITGLTTAQLQAGLPAGFDPTVWAEDPKLNHGLPYLIANPPEKN
jgi:hypothetical protein